MIEFTEKDILRSKIVKPAWYRVKITSYSEVVAKSGTSVNNMMEGVIIKDADSGSTEFAGVPTPANWMFNSKAIGQAVGFVEAITGEKVVPGMRVNLADAIGKELDIWFDNGTYNNQLQNQINHKYRKAREA